MIKRIIYIFKIRLEISQFLATDRKTVFFFDNWHDGWNLRLKIFPMMKFSLSENDVSQKALNIHLFLKRNKMFTGRLCAHWE